MLTLLSPAKTLDFESPLEVKKASDAALLDDAAELAEVLKTYSPTKLRELMHVSEKLAELNVQRFQDWEKPNADNGSRPALFAFQGDVYQGFKATELTEKQLLYAQDHLRILSGLYGVLRPLDRMLPYRLEMGTLLKTERGKDLYQFWGQRITDRIAAQLQVTKSKFLLNLASQEYFRSVRAETLNCPVITPAFKDMKNGKYKMITFFAKQARGVMAAWVMKQRVKTTRKLTRFAEEGYRYDAASSTETEPVFLRG